jgi:thiol:disulfide interchange protein DsbC
MRIRTGGVAAALILLSLVAVAGIAAQPAAVDPRIELAKRLPNAKPEDLRPAPVPGMYEWNHGSNIAYVTADGKYVFGGDLLEIGAAGTAENLTDRRRDEISAAKQPMRQRALAAIPETQMLVFGPRNPRYTVTVFTDIDCPYCRVMHKHIAEYNQLGVKVRYLFFPRSGPDTESWKKADQVWCSENRNEAFTAAILNQVEPGKACAATPIQQHWDLVQKLGLAGTPAIVLADGKLIPGYVDPQALLKELQAAR